ncbi:MAG: hypothetical protein KAY24_17935, partial [Candidatus Eisenbacteria sp.]|nr:hypothetical protein [Candidatus Eisenbacteria bacterium]
MYRLNQQQALVGLILLVVSAAAIGIMAHVRSRPTNLDRLPLWTHFVGHHLRELSTAPGAQEKNASFVLGDVNGDGEDELVFTSDLGIICFLPGKPEIKRSVLWQKQLDRALVPPRGKTRIYAHAC